MNLNKVLIAGRLTADPQLRTTPTGRQVGSFSVATNRVWTSNDGRKQEAVEYHNVVVWDKQAELVSRFLNRGGLVLVEGRLQTRSWDDKQGQKRKTTEIVAERIQFGPRTHSSTGGFGGSGVVNKMEPIEAMPIVNVEEPPASPETSSQEEIKPEDLPF